jgi:Brp/Blh family beta-carotene 15,15'-monooxygenase
MTKGTISTVSKIAVGVTLAAILGALMLPELWVGNFSLLFAIALILAGIPHGAADHLIFRLLAGQQTLKRNERWFYAAYLGVALLYAALWWVLPWAAFIAFLLISAFHFGESNWSRISLASPVVRTSTALLWGAAVIGVPVLRYSENSFLIIEEITGSQIRLPVSAVNYILWFLMLANIGCLVLLKRVRMISPADFLREAGAFVLLMLLFWTTPLLLGFSVYFVFWHSLGTIRDQVEVLRRSDPSFNLPRYLWQLFPFTALSLLGLALMYWFLGDLLNPGANLGVLFLFVSIITVPHAILMNQFYNIEKMALAGVETATTRVV